jgi:hypothetical protein
MGNIHHENNLIAVQTEGVLNTFGLFSRQQCIKPLLKCAPSMQV